MFTAQYWPAF